MIRPHPTLETRYVDHPSPYVLPWWTAPALEWLLGRPVDSWQVLEWGCGLSSVWFNQAARKYVGIESNPAHAIAPGITVVPPDAGISDEQAEFSPNNSRYVGEGVKHPYNDLVVVDGIYRLACIRMAPSLIVPGGCLVVDNANWPEFAGVVDRLRPVFREYHRFTEPGRSPEWSTDVYVGKI